MGSPFDRESLEEPSITISTPTPDSSAEFLCEPDRANHNPPPTTNSATAARETFFAFIVFVVFELNYTSTFSLICSARE